MCPAPPTLVFGISVVVVDGASNARSMTNDAARCLATARSSAVMRVSAVLVAEGRGRQSAAARPGGAMYVVDGIIIDVLVQPSTGLPGPVSGHTVTSAAAAAGGSAVASSARKLSLFRQRRPEVATHVGLASPREARLIRRKSPESIVAASTSTSPVPLRRGTVPLVARRPPGGRDGGTTEVEAVPRTSAAGSNGPHIVKPVSARDGVCHFTTYSPRPSHLGQRPVGTGRPPSSGGGGTITASSPSVL